MHNAQSFASGHRHQLHLSNEHVRGTLGLGREPRLATALIEIEHTVAPTVSFRHVPARIIEGND